MHKRERRLAMLNDNRVVRPFQWGLEFIGNDVDADDPHHLFAEFSRNAIDKSEEYFGIPSAIDFHLDLELQESGLSSAGRETWNVESHQDTPPYEGGVSAPSADGVVHSISDLGSGIAGSKVNKIRDPKSKIPNQENHPALAEPRAPLLRKEGSPNEQRPIVLTWLSTVATPSPENNTSYASYFPHEDHRAAVIVLPHWNARAGTYFDLCRFFNKVGISALRLTLPYHEERMPPELERADYLVAPNVGRTLQSMRQSVVDTRACVAWLKKQGYENVGIVGTSIGSAAAFLAFVHDSDIDAAVFNHVSGYMADVVWHGLSTYHVRAGFGDQLELDELREYWRPVSPMAYMEKLAAQPSRPQRYIYTLYDLSFPIELSRETMRALRRHKIKHSKAAIPCGHYTLGEKPWVYLDGYKIIKFLHKHLK